MALSIIDQAIASEREVCQYLSLSRSQFQNWKQFESTAREDADARLLPSIVSIFHRHRRRYGSRRIVEELKRMDITCSRQRVSKIMKTAGLKAIQPRSFKPRTTESRHLLGYSSNLLLQMQEPTQPHRLWVGDITYIPVQEIGFAYLALLMDRFTRSVIGWDLRDDMTEELTLKALKKSIKATQPEVGLIHHSDRGGQYAGKAYRRMLKRAQMKQSMSRAGDCYDNAFMESCFGTLKTEMEMTEYKSIKQASREITEYLHYYNTQRRHSSLGYLTPKEFEAAA